MIQIFDGKNLSKWATKPTANLNISGECAAANDPVEVPSGGGLPSGGAPNQMLVTDAEGNTKWVDRTHWTEEVTVLPENTVAPDSRFGEGTLAIFEPFVTPLIVGNTYIVTWYGVDYECDAYLVHDGAGVWIGNTAMSPVVGHETDEPFCICYSPHDYSDDIGMVYGYVYDGSPRNTGTHTFSIRETAYRKIPAEYLPNPDWNAKEGEPGHVANKTHYKEVHTVLPETVVNRTTNLGDESRHEVYTPFEHPIIQGKTYNVMFNGVKYECTAYMHGVIDFLVLGDGQVLGMSSSANGEPFLIQPCPDGPTDANGTPYYAMLSTTEELPVTLSISETVIHQLPAEYLPIPTTSGIMDILPETTLMGEDGQFAILEPFADEIVVGKTYTVTYDGTDYTCKAFAIQEGEEAPFVPALGNNIMSGGDDTGEPFVIVYAPPEMVEMAGVYGMVIHMSGLISSVTVRIQGEGGVKIAAEALDMDGVVEAILAKIPAWEGGEY